MCSFCIVNKTKEESKREKEVKALFDAAFFLYLAKGVYSKSITVYNLPKQLYKSTARLLSKTINTKTVLGEELKTSVYRFSAAKTFQQIKEANDLLRDANGRLKDFATFKKDYSVLFTEYNENYLLAEYNTAVASIENAVYWDKIQAQKNDLPYLKYNTQNDSSVRPEHAALNNIVRKVDDMFWSTYMPPNAWNCRCFVTQLNDGNESDVSNIKLNEKQMPEIFRTNSGKTKTVFSDKHPYYKVEDRYANLQAHNFNLPI